MSGPTPESIAEHRAAVGVPDELIPRSIAIIMDGNGRWARQRDLPRPFGHREGAKVVRKIISECADMGLGALTLYSFSQQNWSRPQEEIEALMHLYAEYLIEERPTVMDNNIRLRHLGRREGLPQMVLDELDETARVSSTNTGMFLGLALNYGAREEIAHAARRLARQAVAGEIDPDAIDTDAMAGALDTAGMPDPDLVIRTAGELRISNFLLWQISYAEFYITEKYWPDFDVAELQTAMRTFAQRDRRFGGLTEGNA